MPLNIAHINLAKGLRGGENQTLAIINGLSVFDVRQVLICRKNSLLEKQAQKLNIPSIGIRKPFLLSVSKLKSFDLIHVHEGRSIYFALAANLLFKKPYLVTRRILNKPHEKWLTKLAYRRAEFIVSISHKIDDVMREFLPQHTYKVIPDIARVLISNPNEVNELKNQFSGKFVIGHVGALDNKVKNQLLILNTANLLRDHEDIIFLFFGIGKDESFFAQFVSDSNLTNVFFEGFKENIADYYDLFDVFIYPSKEEGLGSAILEAFNFKCPVIGANVGGIPDILGDDIYGLLINPQSQSELAEAIMKLYDDKSLREYYAEIGFQRRSDFSADKICAQYENIYKSMLFI
jgi:glycosyltransferase involved in cell wall biosynthesis